MIDSRLSREKIELIIKNWKIIADKYKGTSRNILSKSPSFEPVYDYDSKRFELHIPSTSGGKMIFKTGETRHFNMGYDFGKFFDFEFQIYPEDFIEKISKLLGMKDVEIGNSKFDKKYIIKSNNKHKLLEIFDKTVVDYMLEAEIYTCQLKKEETSKLTIMPFIKEYDLNELEKFVVFTNYFIDKIVTSR